MSVSNSMGTKKVEELLANKSMPQGMQFFVPNYQRGYRWKESQVQQLLNDLSEFVMKKVMKAGLLPSAVGCKGR